MCSWRLRAAEGVRNQLFNSWLIEETPRLSWAYTKLMRLPSAIASEDLVLYFASAFGTFAYFSKRTVQRVKYIHWEGMANVLGVSLGSSEKPSSTCIGKVWLKLKGEKLSKEKCYLKGVLKCQLTTFAKVEVWKASAEPSLRQQGYAWKAPWTLLILAPANDHCC